MSDEDGEAIVKLIKAAGARQYTPALLPPDIERGPAGMCFDWCALQAARHRSYTYVEGVALDPDDHEDWILHAWLTDGEHAFDPTWDAISNVTGEPAPMPTIYYGLPMEIHDVRDFMAATGYQGVLANRWRHPEIASRILNKAATLTKGAAA